MTKRDRVIACSMLVVANLCFCFCLASRPILAQASGDPVAAPAKTVHDLPMMPESEMTILNKVFLKIFYPILHPFFKVVNDALLLIPDGVAGLCGAGLFLSAMIWVGVFLNKDYVNRGRPYKSLATDLRIWTVVSMTPHVLVYFYFR